MSTTKAVKFRIPPGTSASPCKGCGVRVFWIETKDKKRMPVDHDGTAHFSTCPKADKFRKPREAKKAEAKESKGYDQSIPKGGVIIRDPMIRHGDFRVLQRTDFLFIVYDVRAPPAQGAAWIGKKGGTVDQAEEVAKEMHRKEESGKPLADK